MGEQESDTPGSVQFLKWNFSLNLTSLNVPHPFPTTTLTNPCKKDAHTQIFPACSRPVTWSSSRVSASGSRRKEKGAQGTAGIWEPIGEVTAPSHCWACALLSLMVSVGWHRWSCARTRLRKVKYVHLFYTSGSAQVLGGRRGHL